MKVILVAIFLIAFRAELLFGRPDSEYGKNFESLETGDDANSDLSNSEDNLGDLGVNSQSEDQKKPQIGSRQVEQFSTKPTHEMLSQGQDFSSQQLELTSQQLPLQQLPSKHLPSKQMPSHKIPPMEFGNKEARSGKFHHMESQGNYGQGEGHLDTDLSNADKDMSELANSDVDSTENFTEMSIPKTRESKEIGHLPSQELELTSQQLPLEHLRSKHLPSQPAQEMVSPEQEILSHELELTSQQLPLEQLPSQPTQEMVSPEQKIPSQELELTSQQLPSESLTADSYGA